MEQTNSSKLIYANEIQASFSNIDAVRPGLKGLALEPLGDLLRVEAPEFPYRPNFEQAVRHPVVVLHTSGSTGTPKPVTMTHGTFMIMDNDRKLPTVAGRKNHDLTIWDFDGSPGRIYEPFPPFHLAGFLNKVMVPLYTAAIPIFGPPLHPPNGLLVAEIMRQQEVRGCMLPPSMADEILHSDDGLACFKKLDVFCYAGGPLSQATGDSISAVTTICQFYGSTEVGQIRQLVPRREDWSYMEFHPKAKLDFRPADDDSFELVVLADSETEESVALNHNFPGIGEWHTKDLFKSHPTKPNLWQFYGRKDDIIVLSNGEKLNPVLMENHLQGSPLISGALITGQNRFQPALLLDIKAPGGKSKQELIDLVWPIVEAANMNVPAHGRIVRSLILFAQNSKPFVRAGKGTIVRKLTERLYSDDIDDVYASLDQQYSPRPLSSTATSFTLDTISELVRSVLPTSLDVHKLEECDNLYISGLDSLKTIEAVNALRSSLLRHRSPSKLTWLSPETFYNNPSIGQLSNLLLAFLNDSEIPQKRDESDKKLVMLEKLAQSLVYTQQTSMPCRKPQGYTIAITGTTGTLGTYLLDTFSHNPMISCIYCLNRSLTAEQQWRNASALNDNKSPKIMFITANFGLKNLGLNSSDDLNAIKGCDFIVHVAWKVDFNQDLSSFTENLESVLTLANWSTSSLRRPRIIFLSSISSVGPWNAAYSDLGIPEAPIWNPSASMSIGYSESKQIAEKLLERAAATAGIPVSVIRIGQIGGPQSMTLTKWTPQELVPSMLRTSRSIGLIPLDLPLVDWIPVDVVSHIVAELALHDIMLTSRTMIYYHVLNPQPVPWEQLIPSVKRFCGPGAQIVQLSQWIEKLQLYDSADSEVLSSKPAVKLLKFFSIVASSGPTTKYQTLATTRASKTMAELPPVNSLLMERWLEQIV